MRADNVRVNVKHDAALRPDGRALARLLEQSIAESEATIVAAITTMRRG